MVYRGSINAKLGKDMLNAGALNFDLQVHRSVYSEKAKQHSLSKFKTTPGRGRCWAWSPLLFLCLGQQRFIGEDENKMGPGSAPHTGQNCLRRPHVPCRKGISRLEGLRSSILQDWEMEGPKGQKASSQMPHSMGTSRPNTSPSWLPSPPTMCPHHGAVDP